MFVYSKFFFPNFFTWKGKKVILGNLEGRREMGVLSTLLGFCGFGVGVWGGVVVGYYLFIYFQPTDVKVRFWLLFCSVILFNFSVADFSVEETP